MKRILAALVVTATLTFATPSFAQDKMAIVDVAIVMTKAKEFDSLKNGWTVKGKDLENEEAKLKNDLATLQSQRDATMKMGSPEFDKMTLDILKKQNEGNFQLQLAKAMLNGQQKQAVNALYAKVRTTVESVAKEEGYTLVINNLIPQITEQAVNEMNINQFLSFILQSSTIMYSDPSINITEKVLTKLDAEYSDTAPATPAEGD